VVSAVAALGFHIRENKPLLSSSLLTPSSPLPFHSLPHPVFHPLLSSQAPPFPLLRPSFLFPPSFSIPSHFPHLPPHLPHFPFPPVCPSPFHSPPSTPNRTKGLGEHCKLPSGSGRSPIVKRLLVFVGFISCLQ